jgi:hypothetical protein
MLYWCFFFHQKTTIDIADILNYQFGVFTVNECTVQLLAIFLGKFEVLKTLSNSFLLYGNYEYQQKLF